MEACCVCQKPKATLKCAICESAVCKYCAQFLEEDQFSFMEPKTVPKFLKETTFCGPCFDAKVQPEIDNYNDLMNKARNLTVYHKEDSKITRTFKRIEKPYKVECCDREETLLRMAFLAVQNNFNAIIDVDITSKKIRNGSYQTTLYKGTAMPTQIISGRMR